CRLKKSLHLLKCNDHLLLPTRIQYVIVTYYFAFTCKVRSVYFFHSFSGHTCIDTTRLQYHLLENNSPCRHNDMRMYYAIIHNDSTHSYQYIIMYGTSMHNSIMTYRDIITYKSRMFLICTMNYSSILHIYFVSHFYIMYIATYYRIVPNTTL